MLKLYLVRHGQTIWNAEHRIQGHLQVALDETGRWQAEQIARRLLAVHRNEPFSALYSSDLERARETAEIIAQRLSLSVTTTPDLRERCWGCWEGLTRPEIEANYREEYAEFLKDRLHYHPPGAESIEALIVRTRRAFHAILSEPTISRVIIVGHGGSLRVLISEALQIGIEALRRTELANTSLSVIEWNDGRGHLTLMNDTCHLREG